MDRDLAVLLRKQDVREAEGSDREAAAASPASHHGSPPPPDGVPWAPGLGEA